MRRLIVATMVTAGLLAGPAALPAAGATGSYLALDGTADAADGRGDITNWAVIYDVNQLTLSARLYSPADPATDVGWSRDATGFLWSIDTDLDAAVEFDAVLFSYGGALSATVFVTGGAQTCTATPVFADGVYSIVLSPTACLGGAGALRVSAYAAYDTGAVVSEDFAPNAGWSEVVSPAPPPPAPPGWKAETLDGQGGTGGRLDADVGSHTATGILNGVPHVFAYDATAGNLRHTWWAGTTWGFETLDGAGGQHGRITADVGQYPSFATFGGIPHAFYYDATGGDLRHGWWTGTVWGFETLDGAGGANGRRNANLGLHTSVLDASGVPHVYSYEVTSGNLRHGWWTGVTWGFENLDGAGGSNGRVSSDLGQHSTTSMYGGAPHLWYYDSSGGNLRHAWWVGAARAWSFERLDGAGGANGRIDSNVGQHARVAIYGGAAHVFSYEAGNGNLRHAWWVEGARAWFFETLDGAGGAGGRVLADAGAYVSVAEHAGIPHAWYYDATNGDLRHGWWAGTAWGFETLDGAGGPDGRLVGDLGRANASVLFGTAHVFGYDATNGDLRHVWYG